MERIDKYKGLSIIIPTKNEAQTLPLLLADLKIWPLPIEIVVVDSGSSDSTCLIAKLSGAKVLKTDRPCRGLQLNLGASVSSGNSLLFLHADSRLSTKWPDVVKNAMNGLHKNPEAWFFEFRVNKHGLDMRLMEIMVSIRSNLFKQPYGDQGLLISKSLYNFSGGYKPMELMEDLEFIERLAGKVKLKSLNLPLYTNGRRWERNHAILVALKNFSLRQRWRKGESSASIFREYYNQKR
ncbi:TIGR04283 family arsenosugar biosynthesis glycosyltransferase [Prochlorococcus sp. MIT 1341]|uniref:TIGR04283 family arsenosugar biosynthesis glycosyltransferase n=1 Tax=Prochlorococcus sp. MIT 1341 TaxID=3096221 RepID=UPI002A747F1D|nr:TIGR04283 family arsenosugar biosynthesis glycosyltransferase [Prochlorococcus sp. MIT 1341]